MDEAEVVALMESSNSPQEWDANCDKVKAACNGYPSFWYGAVIMSGVHNRTRAKWGDTGPAMKIYVG